MTQEVNVTRLIKTDDVNTVKDTHADPVWNRRQTDVRGMKNSPGKQQRHDISFTEITEKGVSVKAIFSTIYLGFIKTSSL